MKTKLSVLIVTIFASTITGWAQVETFKAADLVLGAPDLTTPGTQANTAAGINNPNGVAIDPMTQKVFVTATVQHRILRYGSASSLSNGDPAEAVLGQPDFTTATAGTSRDKLNFPNTIHMDLKGRLWVVDTVNHRVLMFKNAANLPNGSPADLVLGQPDFTTNANGNSASQMNGPVGVFIDRNDNLWVADGNNNRVLKFASVSMLSNGAPASVVVGQTGFGLNVLGTSDSGMRYAVGAVVDADDHLWVADLNNNRILRFANASTLGNGAAASGVLGQAIMTQGGQGLAADRMSAPHGLLVDPNGTLWVNDFGNNRVLCFMNAKAKANGAPADYVLGQADFVTGTSGLSAQRLSHPSQGISRDNAGNLWISDRDNHRVIRYPAVAVDENIPTLTVLSRPPKVTRKGKVPFFGSASDPGVVKGIYYRVGKGAFRAAAGTASWRFIANLKRDKKNVIQVYADDLGGNNSTVRTYRITRK